MEDGERLSLEQIRAFVEASGEMRFHSQDRRELYAWVNQTLGRQNYSHLKRQGKGLVRRYLAQMTGLSRAQMTRLIGCYQQGGEVKPRASRPQRSMLDRSPRIRRTAQGAVAFSTMACTEFS